MRAAALRSRTRRVVTQKGASYSLSRRWRTIIPDIVAVEIKVHNWRRGLGQAARNRIFSHRSYLGLPESVAKRVRKDKLFGTFGIGIIGIAPSGRIRIANAIDYSDDYRDAGADILLDPQFYVPQFRTKNLTSYPTAKFRQSIKALGALQVGELTRAIEGENRALGTAAVIAPAVPYEAARADIIALNSKLFEAAKAAGDSIGVPTYATVVLGQSATTGAVAENILSSATALSADGWYYGFEFGTERLPTDLDAVYRYCAAALTLACTGKPVLHACAGPMGLMAFGAGARAAGLGFWQNLWGFERARWQATEGQGGGGGKAPARFFSVPLWGTIVYPDETAQLSLTLRSRVMLQSPLSTPTANSLVWKKWDAHKHLIHMIARTVQRSADLRNARKAMSTAVNALETASVLHLQIRKTGLQLRDNTASYQPVWVKAGKELLNKNSNDFDYLEMIGGP